MTKHNGVITKTPAPSRLYLSTIDVAVAISNRRHLLKPREDSTEYVRGAIARELAESCTELINVVVALSGREPLNAKQRYALVKAKSALGKSRHILRSQV